MIRLIFFAQVLGFCSESIQVPIFEEAAKSKLDVSKIVLTS